MSRAIDEVVAALRDGPLTVYQLKDRVGRSCMSVKTTIFDLRRCGYVVNQGHIYPALYTLTEKASGEILITRRKKEGVLMPTDKMVKRSIAKNANSVFSLGAML